MTPQEIFEWANLLSTLLYESCKHRCAFSCHGRGKVKMLNFGDAAQPEWCCEFCSASGAFARACLGRP
jgi:hypothetical protein